MSDGPWLQLVYETRPGGWPRRSVSVAFDEARSELTERNIYAVDMQPSETFRHHIVRTPAEMFERLLALQGRSRDE